MSLLVLHLSDIHILNDTTELLRLAPQIARSAFPAVHDASMCLILVTGDIAYSGSADEFRLAETFLNRIREDLQNESHLSVDILVTAGNHDCVLRPEDSVRSILIDRIVTDPSAAEDPCVVEHCVSAQKNFFEFRNRVTKHAPQLDHPLWTEYAFLVDEKLIRISAINAAWMSRIPEKPGQLVFPANAFLDVLSEPADLRLAMIHHPLNWYTQHTYHDLRANLRRHCSGILSGHEHLGATGQILDSDSGASIYFEADALNPHEQGLSPGYSLMFFSFASAEVEVKTFRKGVDGFEQVDKRSLSFSDAVHAAVHNTTLTPDFERTLQDPGGAFTHPDKDKITLGDVFVFPEMIYLDKKNKDDSRYIISSEQLLLPKPENTRLLLVGEDKAGKTCLLQRFFLEFHKSGYWPLLISASRTSVRSADDVAAILTNLVTNEYRDNRCFESAPKSKKIALVDDIDRLKGGPRYLGCLMEGLKRHFETIILTASQGFEIRELVSTDAAASLADFQTVEFLRFGHALRHRLITRWCQIASWSTLADLDREIHAAEQLINSVLQKNLAPSLPLYLLVLLQSYSQHQQGEIQHSSFARYYEYLIVRSLVRAGVRPDSYDELFNYLSQLAWFFREAEIEEATRAQLLGFNRVFSEKFTSVDLDARLDLLISTRLLSVRGDCFEFTYPYIYYFFLGRWLAKNLEKPGIKEKVELWANKLYLRKNSSALIFSSYHANSEWIIDSISAVLDRCFSDSRCLTLDADIGAINNLVDSASKVLLSEPDIPTNQEKARRLRDEMELNETGGDGVELDDDVDDMATEAESTKHHLEDLSRVNLLLKTAEILGQIVKNYYGSLERDTKEELLRKVIEGPLRLLNALIEQITEGPAAFVLEMEKIILVQHPDLDTLERKKVANKVAFELLGIVTTGLLLRAASWIASRQVEEDVHNVVRANGSVAFRLTEAASKLVLPREVPHDEIRRLAKDLRGNAFAFKVLQAMAIRHLHLFHVPRQDKQRLCHTLQIEFADSRFIDLRTKDTKLLKSSDN